MEMMISHKMQIKMCNKGLSVFRLITFNRNHNHHPFFQRIGRKLVRLIKDKDKALEITIVMGLTINFK